MRLIFIPFLGISIPFLSTLISYPLYSSTQIIFIHLYFIFMSWSIWTCSAWLHRKIRNWFTVQQNIILKISTITIVNAQFAGATAGILTLVWYKISRETFAWLPYLLCIVLCILAAIVFTLIYEILYLGKERQMDTKIVHQLGWERNVAEMSNLKNELEPHFIFNSLNALSYLILNDHKTAHIFNSKLATIYKYFLINKEKRLISLKEEIEFLEDYFYLLKLRHENKIELFVNLNVVPESSFMIVPFALQITLENAIKHNEFSEEYPLHIYMDLKGNYMMVKNKIKPTRNEIQSTGIGLKNLKMRYQLYCGKQIAVKKSTQEFTVQLPLIQKIN